MKSTRISIALLFALPLAASCSSTAPRRFDEHPHGHSQRGNWSTSGGAYEIGLGLGGRRQGDEWGQADDLFSYFALDLSLQPKYWPLEFTTRINAAAVSERPDFSSTQVDSVDLFELDFGLRAPLDFGGGVRGHIGAGVAWVEVTVSDDRYYYFDGKDEVDDDDDLGWWAGAGIALPLGGGHGLGLDARWTEVDDLVLENRAVDASGFTLLLTYSFRRSFP